MSERKQGRRSAQDAEKTKCEIMRVATELFCELGYERVSLRNISEKAGVSHSLIRHHFGSKEKIWYAISDGLHEYMASYMRVMLENMPENATSNVKLYQFSVRLLAHLLIHMQPMQLIADAVRQEDALFDYFLDSKGDLENIIYSLADDYNASNPDATIKIWEIKWQMMMFAHGAASLGPFMKETWIDETEDYDECLLKHWSLYNQLMLDKFKVPEEFALHPKVVADLVYDHPCIVS